uniref:Uncharacterized protein n=1 Tax=Meloidogyne enterolobii TaxID=390850 RepID=A0A6V7UKZ2_MELEN|nr:unnamed protein product [Meloidogyne enterolobii]
MNFIFVSILFLLTKISILKISLASIDENNEDDEDINKGNLYRREEFNNKSEPEFYKNIARINEFRHVNSEWSVAHKCRISSSFHTNEQCINTNQFCFSAQLNYNFIEQNYKFGNFPKQLEFLRHFPRCWLRLAPLICLGHYRPCEVSSKNIANQLYVLMEQFSMTSCTNMLNHCGFAMEHLLTHSPGYLNCDAFFEGNKSGNNSDKIIYKKDCKINYTKVHPELASLATDSYQCLWPLINPGRLSLINDGFTNSSLNKIQVEPVIDGCYLPCRSPLFNFENLHNYNFVVAILHFCIVVFILLSISFIVAKNSQKHFCRRQKHQLNNYLPNTFRFSIFSILFFIAINSLIMAISILPQNEGEGIIGDLAICLNLNGILIRRSSENLLNDGGNGVVCALQAFILNFSSLFINSSFILFLIKLLLPSKLLKLIYFVLPKFNSLLFPISIFLFSFICALFDLYYNKIFIDPVNGLCNYFLHNQIFSRLIFAYLIIALCLFGLIYYINWIKYSQKKEKLMSRANIKKNKNCDFELKQKMLEMSKSEKSCKVSNESHQINIEQHEEERFSQFSSSSKIYLQITKNLQNIFNFYLNKIFILLIILLTFRIYAGNNLISQEEERQLILRSINCSINRSLAEGTSLNWINMTHYKTIEKAETNPEIRRRLLGEKTSAPYCQLLPQKLVWYWIFSILIFIWHFGIIIVLLTIEQNSELILKENESKMVEIDEDNVELQQLNNNIPCNIENKNDKINADDLQHAIENEHHYDRISSTPASTLSNPNNNLVSTTNSQQLQQQQQSPPLPPLTSPPQINPINDLLSSSDALTALYYHYYFSQYSLPPQFVLPQQLGGNGNCCKFHQENLRDTQQNSDQTPYTSNNSAVVQKWMKNGCCSSNTPQQKEAKDKRKRAGSDPGTTRSLENQQINNSSDRNNNKNRRHRVLHIRGAPKELQKEWRKRRELREGGKNSKNYSSIGGEGEISKNPPQLSTTKNELNNISQNPLQNSCTTSSQQHHQHQCFCKLILLPQPSFPPLQQLIQQQQNFCLLNCCQQQQPMILPLIPSCWNNSGANFDLQATPTINQQQRQRNQEEEHQERSTSSSSETTEVEPSSSINNDEGEETNSNDFDSDSPDSFEEKRWEELTKKQSSH